MSGHGTIHWSELCSADVEASTKFFQTIAGWQVNPMEMPNGTYNVCMKGEQPVAGIMDMKMLDDPNVRPHWMTYIAVDDVDASAGQTASSGGTVVRAPFDIPGVGRIAIIQDPGQGIVGIMTPAQQG